MTIIDILNNIANKKEVPEKVKYNNKIYIYDCITKDYYENFDKILEKSLFGYLFSNQKTDHFINKEVEIIGEDKEIEDILTKYNADTEKVGITYANSTYELSQQEVIITDKVNELIKAVNKINKQLNK